MSIDLKQLRATVERYCDDEASEDLDAEKFGNTVTPFTVLGLLDRIDALEAALDELLEAVGAYEDLADRDDHDQELMVAGVRYLAAQLSAANALRTAGSKETK